MVSLSTYLVAGQKVGWANGARDSGPLTEFAVNGRSADGMHSTECDVQALLSLAFSFDSSEPISSPWQVMSEAYNSFWLSNHLLIPSVLAASKATSQRHFVLIAWALGLVLIINVPYGLFFSYY